MRENPICPYVMFMGHKSRNSFRFLASFGEMRLNGASEGSNSHEFCHRFLISSNVLLTSILTCIPGHAVYSTGHVMCICH